MWSTSYHCEDGIVISSNTNHIDPSVKMGAFRDYIGHYGGGTWIETEKGWADIKGIYVQDNFVIAIETDTGVMIENPCLCAAVNSLNRIEQWLKAGGVVVNMGARNGQA